MTVCIAALLNHFKVQADLPMFVVKDFSKELANA
jgi:hypothetical protein